jgi:hypothetical protein
VFQQLALGYHPFSWVSLWSLHIAKYQGDQYQHYRIGPKISPFLKWPLTRRWFYHRRCCEEALLQTKSPDFKTMEE